MDTVKLSERIKTLCKEKKISVKALLEECNINRNFIYDLKMGQTPSIDKLERISAALHCSIDDLLGSASAASDIAADESYVVINGKKKKLSAEKAEQLVKVLEIIDPSLLK